MYFSQISKCICLKFQNVFCKVGLDSDYEPGGRLGVEEHVSTFLFALQTAQKHCSCLKDGGQTDLKLFNVFHFAKQSSQQTQRVCGHEKLICFKLLDVGKLPVYWQGMLLRIGIQ